MKKLNDNWFVEGHIDLEYQQYVLLDYLQSAKNFYTEFRLYPYLSDLIKHNKNLIQFQEEKIKIFNKFPKRIKGFSLVEHKLNYEPLEKDTLSTVSEIIDFALPEIQKHIEIGQALYDAIDKQIKLEPIGIQPLYKKEGYVMISAENFIKVFQFKISSLELNDEKLIGINFTHLNEYDANIDNPNIKMKFKIIEKNRDITGACSYYVKLHKDFSNVLEESILPILKRKIIIA